MIPANGFQNYQNNLHVLCAGNYRIILSTWFYVFLIRILLKIYEKDKKVICIEVKGRLYLTNFAYEIYVI